jgi:hypothetical protein
MSDLDIHLRRPKFNSLPKQVRERLENIFEGYVNRAPLNQPDYWKPMGMEAVSYAYELGLQTAAAKLRDLADELDISPSKTSSSKTSGEKA